MLAVTLNCCLTLHVDVEQAGDAASGQYLDCSWSASERRKYVATHSLSEWPCTARPDFRKRNGKKTIVCVGDSITHGSHVLSNETYPAKLHSLFHEEFNVLNLGISGSTAQRARESSYWSFPQWRVAQEIGFDLAIVQLGTNDAKTLNWDPSTYTADLHRMLKQLAAGHPQARLLVSVPPRVVSNNFTIQADVVAEHLPDAIRALPRDPGLGLDFVDMQAAFASARRPFQDLLLPDGVHPNAGGYQLMAEAAAAAVRRALG